MLPHDQHLYQSPAIGIEICQWSLQTIITLTECAKLTFLQSGDEQLQAWPKIKPVTLDLSSQSGA